MPAASSSLLMMPWKRRGVGVQGEGVGIQGGAVMGVEAVQVGAPRVMGSGFRVNVPNRDWGSATGFKDTGGGQGIGNQGNMGSGHIGPKSTCEEGVNRKGRRGRLGGS